MKKVVKHIYFIRYRLSNTLEPQEHWTVMHLDNLIMSGDHVNKILSALLVEENAEPPILPLELSYLGTFNYTVPGSVILYQPGKVGSVSIKAMLENQKFDVLHVHGFNEAGEFNSRNSTSGLKQIMKEEGSYTVVNLVRNPLDRNVSAFFWNLNTYVERNWRDKYSDHIVSAFVNNYPHNLYFEWYERELNKTLNFDVLGSYFNKEQGYDYYEREDSDLEPKFKLLILRTEDLTNKAQEALSKFLNVEFGKVPVANQTSLRNPIAGIYNAFHQHAILPEELLNYYLSQPLTKFFYTDDEINALWDRWSNAPENGRYQIDIKTK